MTLARKQWASTWEELNFWYGMLLTAEDNPRWLRAGLCSMARNDFDEDALPYRALDNCPKPAYKYSYWWTAHSWKPRITFICKMIRLCEEEMATL